MVVADPAALMAMAGRVSGTARGQDAFLGDVVAAARGPRAADGRATALEAWSQSFRREPPGPLGEEGATRPAAATVGGLLRGLGLSDPRLLLVIGAVLLAALTWRHAPAASPLPASAVLLAPAMVSGIVFGAPEVLSLAALCVASTRRASRPFRSGLAAGVAGGFSLAALPAAVPLIAPWEGKTWKALATGAALGYAALVVPGLAVGALSPPRIGPGIGVPNVLLPVGAPASALIVASAASCALTAAAAVLVGRSTRSQSPLAFAAAAALSLAALWSLPSGSAHSLALPLGLLALSATFPGPAPSR
jgi:hypothetical protein